jgi:hypothetical protein
VDLKVVPLSTNYRRLITILDIHLKIQLKPKGFFHNTRSNKGVNGLLNNKDQISLLFKKKIGILAAILPEEIRFNFWVFV